MKLIGHSSSFSHLSLVNENQFVLCFMKLSFRAEIPGFEDII
jgi:hypothetical protein